MAKALKLYIYDNLYPRQPYPQVRAIGKRLQQLRLDSYNPEEGRYYLQRELAKEFGTTQSSIKNYENSLRKIPHKMLEKYRDFFRVSIDWIITGHGVGPMGKAT